MTLQSCKPIPLHTYVLKKFLAPGRVWTRNPCSRGRDANHLAMSASGGISWEVTWPYWPHVGFALSSTWFMNRPPDVTLCMFSLLILNLALFFFRNTGQTYQRDNCINQLSVFGIILCFLHYLLSELRRMASILTSFCAELSPPSLHV